MRWRVERDVRRFHKKFGHPTAKRPTLPSPEWRELRKSLILEEAGELAEALEAGNMMKIARECVDVIYVTVGTLVAYGLPLSICWRVVHNANMRKVPSDLLVSKPLKPVGWIDPDRILKRKLGGR